MKPNSHLPHLADENDTLTCGVETMCFECIHIEKGSSRETAIS